MKQNTPAVPFVPMPKSVIDDLLGAAELTDADVVCDLGCGDGRVLIEAVRKSGARGIGLDCDPQRLKEARQRALDAGVAGRIDLYEGDFGSDEMLRSIGVSEATVVVLYLLPDITTRLWHRLLKLLKPGTRLFSYAFSIHDDAWPPEQMIPTESIGGLENASYIYLWHVPGKG